MQMTCAASTRSLDGDGLTPGYRGLALAALMQALADTRSRDLLKSLDALLFLLFSPDASLLAEAAGLGELRPDTLLLAISRGGANGHGRRSRLSGAVGPGSGGLTTKATADIPSRTGAALATGDSGGEQGSPGRSKNAA